VSYSSARIGSVQDATAPAGVRLQQIRAGSPRHTASRWCKTFAELLIDCEEDRTLRAVLVGIMREGDR